MTDLLYHAAQQRAIVLGERLADVLHKIDDPRTAALIARIVPQAHDRTRLVFTGQWSSGKSTLIKALTDGGAEVVIDSDIATGKVTEFDWDGIVALVDTPGVQAGIYRHDRLAEEAIAAADLVLFAITVDLFDDAATEYLQHVIDTLGKRDQLLVVITKANSMHAGPGIREAAVREALGPSNADVPFIECDARDYLDGLAHPDSVRAAAYRSVSNIDRVRGVINDISARRGDLGRYRQPFQVIKAVSLEAESLLTEDPDEAAALALLARQRSALTARRERMGAKLEELASRFRTESVRAAEAFADDVESIAAMPDGSPREGKISAFTEHLNESLNDAADRLGEGVGRVMEQQFEDLAAEVREIEAAPHTRVVLSLAHDAEVQAGHADIRVGDRASRGPQTRSQVPPWSGHAGRWLKEFRGSWGAGEGVRASAGTVGHKVVLKTGHLFGKQFKPWQAVRVADRIGKATKFAGAFLTVAAEFGAVVAEERAEMRAQEERARRRRDLINEVVRQADDIAHTSTKEVASQLDAEFATAYANIDSVHDAIVSARTQRTVLSTELREIETEADVALDRLATK